MTLFHTNDAGVVGACKATKQCPFGAARHGSSPAEARQLYEKAMEEEAHRALRGVGRAKEGTSLQERASRFADVVYGNPLRTGAVVGALVTVGLTGGMMASDLSQHQTPVQGTVVAATTTSTVSYTTSGKSVIPVVTYTTEAQVKDASGTVKTISYDGANTVKAGDSTTVYQYADGSWKQVESHSPQALTTAGVTGGATGLLVASALAIGIMVKENY